MKIDLLTLYNYRNYNNLNLKLSSNINIFTGFNAQGKIIDFEVMIRPMSGLAALAEKMGARFAQYQPNTSQ